MKRYRAEIICGVSALIIAIALATVSARNAYSQQSTTLTVEDVFNRLGHCKFESDLKDVEIQQLQSQVAVLSKQLADIQTKNQPEK